VSALWFIITALATYRLTRLVTADEITKKVRGWVVDRSEWFGYLVTCDWCLSIWVAPVPTILVLNWGDQMIVKVGLVALALSALTGLLSLFERRLDL
jgi:hypothetical protein